MNTKKSINRNRMQQKVYRRYIPQFFEDVYHERITFFGQFWGVVLFTGFLAYVVFWYLSPLGETLQYTSAKDSTNPDLIGTNKIVLGPAERIKEEEKDGEVFYRQTHDLIYFTTKMPLKFDEAKVRVIFQNNEEEQPFYIGFQDKPVWHYEKKLFDIPFLNMLEWDVQGENPTLYQRKKVFSSVEDFLQNPPEHVLIGTYAYESDIGDISKTTLPQYAPQEGNTVISVPLRGKHVLYAYLENEPFHFSLKKQDLNWYEDPDTLSITIYKDNQQVYQSIIADDGITDASHNVTAPQEISLQNPGPGFPESGVYKIVLDANNDTIIKEIQTNLHKIVFARSIFPIENNLVYPSVFSETTPTTFFTNSLMLSAVTHHREGQQTISIGEKQQVKLDGLNTEQWVTPEDIFAKVTTTKNDVRFNTLEGYTAFTPEQFFLPSRYHVSLITKPDDTSFVDYILADYTPSKPFGKWKVQERTFDLQTAHLTNGQLTWAIMAPQLEENKREIQIKEITVTLHKKPWN